MGTTRLQLEPSVQPIIIRLDSLTGPLEIEVPAGESHYFLHTASKKDPSWEHQVFFHIRHPFSRLKVGSLVVAKGESTPYLKTEVIHHAKNTQAETLVKTLAHDNAHPKYEGTIRIIREAQGVESYLNHHSLLLGTQAKSWTRPSLEIEADQVKCSHAATIRTITEHDLFYLRSRGIPKNVAQTELIQGFVSELLPLKDLVKISKT